MKHKNNPYTELLVEYFRLIQIHFRFEEKKAYIYIYFEFFLYFLP